MSQATLVTSAIIGLVSAAVYGYLGYRLGGRDVEPEAKTAAFAFAAWWVSLAASTVLTAGLTLLAAFGTVELDLFLAITTVQLAVITFAVGALLYYLIYLFLGRVPFTWLLILGYVMFFGILAYWVQWSDPIGVEVRPWQVSLDNRRPQEGPFFLAVVVLLIGPQIAAALAYASLLFRLKGRTQRFRVALVSGSIIVWFGSAFVASAAGVAESDVWQLASRMLGLLAPLTILFAYQPPAWAQRRLGVEPLARPRRRSPSS